MALSQVVFTPSYVQKVVDMANKKRKKNVLAVETY